MTVPPFTEDPEGARPYFRQLRELRDRLAARNLPAYRLEQLSMGMSHDFEVAIEEGSTCVRIGTAIFGERPNPRDPDRPGVSRLPQVLIATVSSPTGRRLYYR